MLIKTNTKVNIFLAWLARGCLRLRRVYSQYVDILTHRYMRICRSEGMFERSGHQSGHTGLRTPVLISKLPDLLRSRILMDWTVLSPESYCNAGLFGTDPIMLR